MVERGSVRIEASSGAGSRPRTGDGYVWFGAVELELAGRHAAPFLPLGRLTTAANNGRRSKVAESGSFATSDMGSGRISYLSRSCSVCVSGPVR